MVQVNTFEKGSKTIYTVGAMLCYEEKEKESKSFLPKNFKRKENESVKNFIQRWFTTTSD
jgi:hypothetical protein